jgi:hypothetical protein
MNTLNLVIQPDKRPYCGSDVLCYYDGPQLFWLPCEGRRLLAVALPDDAGQWPFLVVELTEEQAQNLEGNRVTLLAVCLACKAKWHMRDYGADTLVLEPLSGPLSDDWLPGDVLLRPEGDVQ